MSTSQRLNTSMHSLNKSSSKQKFSFSKANRFLPPVKPLCEQSFYNLPDTKERRACSFGVGNKTEMAYDKKNIPPPDRYKIEGDKKRGFSFGFGREEVVGGPLSHTKRTKLVPGPGEYATRSTLHHISTTLKSRLPDHSYDQAIKVPGPGSYNPPSAMSAKGNYILSKFHGSACRTISPEGSPHRLTTLTPGPGEYDYKSTTIDPQGRYFVGKFHNSNVRTFSKSPRPEVAQKQQIKVPGPGAYGMFSEFG